MAGAGNGGAMKIIEIKMVGEADSDDEEERVNGGEQC